MRNDQMGPPSGISPTQTMRQVGALPLVYVLPLFNYNRCTKHVVWLSFLIILAYMCGAHPLDRTAANTDPRLYGTKSMISLPNLLFKISEFEFLITDSNGYLAILSDR